MSFLGLRKWPTPVSKLVVLQIFRLVPNVYLQVFRPMWAFFAASGLTFYLVSKAQDAGVKCTWFVMYWFLLT